MTDKASKQAYDPATYRSNTRHGITTGVFSSNNPHRAPLLCYIAGIECHYIGGRQLRGVEDSRGDYHDVPGPAATAVRC